MDRTVASILPKLPDVMKRNRIKEDHAPASKNKSTRRHDRRDNTDIDTHNSVRIKVRGEKWSPVNVPME